MSQTFVPSKVLGDFLTSPAFKSPFLAPMSMGKGGGRVLLLLRSLRRRKRKEDFDGAEWIKEKKKGQSMEGMECEFFLSSYAKARVERMCTIQDFLHVANVVTLLI